MAKCRRCGKEYDADQAKETLWKIIGIFTPKVMGGLCEDCAMDDYDDRSGTDVRREFENMDEEEMEEHIRNSIETRYELDSEFREWAKDLF